VPQKLKINELLASQPRFAHLGERIAKNRRLAVRSRPSLCASQILLRAKRAFHGSQNDYNQAEHREEAFAIAVV
jgi:hypothetical protein